MINSRLKVIQFEFLLNAEGDLTRFASKPKDFTYAELKRLLNFFDYYEEQGAGSRVVFVNKKNGHKIKLHKPHPGNILKRYQIELIRKELKDRKLI